MLSQTRSVNTGRFLLTSLDDLQQASRLGFTVGRSGLLEAVILELHDKGIQGCSLLSVIGVILNGFLREGASGYFFRRNLLQGECRDRRLASWLG